MSCDPYLSLVIPAYNEEGRIWDTLGKVTRYLKTRPFSWEVVVVDDGSTDTTANLVRSYIKDNPGVHLISVPHGGKGWAVKHGMLQSQGTFRFLCDTDLSMPIEYLAQFLPSDGHSNDIIIGSREVPGARRVGEPLGRHIMGRTFNLFCRLLAVPGVHDTQCGFKSFKGHVAERLSNLQRINGFGFDVEILFLAKKFGIKVLEIPVEWHYRSCSKVSPFQDSIRMMGDLLSIRWHNLRGHYTKVKVPPRKNYT